MQLPMTIGLRRSRILAGLFCLCHSLAAIALIATPWSNEIRAALLVALVLAAAASWSQLAPDLPLLRLGPQGELALGARAGEEFEPVEPLGGPSVHPWLTVLRYRRDGRVRGLVVLSDAMAVEDFRYFRVWLRWRGDFSATAGDVD